MIIQYFLYRVYGLAVKRLLEEYNLNPDSIKGTGRVNRLLKGDVLSYIEMHNIKRSAPKFGKCHNNSMTAIASFLKL